MYTPGKSKKEIRKKVFYYFIKNSANNILSLSNLNFDLEEKLIVNKCMVTTIEKNKSIYKKQLKIKTKGVKIKYNTLGKENCNKYNGLFLDMCGPYSDEIDKSLHQIKSGSSVVLTLLKARENKKIQKIINIANRIESYKKLFTSMNFKIDETIEYQDTRYSKMAVFFLKKL